jgi:NADP-dependent alcohol dehydrogenase
MLSLGKPMCASIHMTGHQLTAKYGIDHGATLAICAKGCLESQREVRKAAYAESAGVIFGVWEGTIEERAEAFIEKLQQFIVEMGLPTKVAEWPGVVAAPGDVEEILQGILTTAGAPAVGFKI